MNESMRPGPDQNGLSGDEVWLVSPGSQAMPVLGIRARSARGLRTFLEEEFPDPSALVVLALAGTWQTGLDCLVLPCWALESLGANPAGCALLAVRSCWQAAWVAWVEHPGQAVPEIRWFRRQNLRGSLRCTMVEPAAIPAGAQVLVLAAPASGAAAAAEAAWLPGLLAQLAQAWPALGFRYRRHRLKPWRPALLAGLPGRSAAFVAASLDRLPRLPGSADHSGLGRTLALGCLALGVSAILLAAANDAGAPGAGTVRPADASGPTVARTEGSPGRPAPALQPADPAAGLAARLDAGPDILDCLARLAGGLAGTACGEVGLAAFNATASGLECSLVVPADQALDWRSRIEAALPELALVKLGQAAPGRTRLDFHGPVQVRRPQAVRAGGAVGPTPEPDGGLAGRRQVACRSADLALGTLAGLAAGRGLELVRLSLEPDHRQPSGPAGVGGSAFELQGSFPAAIRFLADLAPALPETGLRQLSLVPLSQGRLMLKGVYGPGGQAGPRARQPDCLAGLLVLAPVDSPGPLAGRGQGYHKPSKTAGQAGAACAPGPADRPAGVMGQGTAAPRPGQGRFVVRGSTGSGGEQVWLLKDLVLDRMVWVPGDPDWALQSRDVRNLVLVNREGRQEEACF